MLLLTALASGAFAAEPPVRYKIDTGDWLIYERRALVESVKSGEKRRREVDQIQLWCFERRQDERLLLLDRIRIENDRTQPMHGIVLHADVRGVPRFDDSMQRRLPKLDGAFDILPVLRPAVPDRPEWVTTPDFFGRTWRCTENGPDVERSGHIQVAFTLSDPTGVCEALGQTRSGRYWIDPVAGVLTRLESHDEDRAADERTETVIALRHRVRNEDRWCAQRTAEAARYARTILQEDRLSDEVLARRVDADAALGRLDRLWASFANDLLPEKQSPFRVLASARRELLESTRASIQARGRYASSRLERPAPQWALQDLAGRTVRSESFRDQWSIECLWSVTSPESLRMFEQLRRIQRELADRRVKVICLNFDRDIESARRIGTRCGQELTHVLAESMTAIESPPEFPLIRVITRDGTIKGILAGWCPNLGPEVLPLLQ